MEITRKRDEPVSSGRTFETWEASFLHEVRSGFRMPER
jgi:hypothetical protein